MNSLRRSAFAVSLWCGCLSDDPDDTAAQTADGGGASTAAGTAGSSSDAATTTTTSLDDGSSSGSSGGNASCGNGTVEPGEQCDSEPFAGHACPDTCRFPERLEIWSVRVDLDGGMDRGFDLAVDDAGLIGAVGESAPGGPEAGNVLVAIITAEGELTCAKGHAAGAGTNEFAEAVSAAHGVLAVAGRRGDEIWAGGFSGSCDLSWDLSLAGENPDASYWASSVVDMGGDGLLVTATADLPEPLPGYLVTLSPKGLDPTVSQIAGPLDGNGNGTLWDLHGALLPGGDIALMATTFARARLDGWLERRGRTGDVLWETFIEAPDPAGTVRVADLAVDGAGDLIVTADWPTVTDDGIDIVVRRYAPDGQQRWTSIYSGPMGLTDEAGGVAVDLAGNVYMHGRTEVGPEDHDMVAQRLSPDGDVVWTETWSAPATEPFNHDYGAEVEVDPRGLVVLLGYTYAQATNYDVLVRVIAP